jgi:hypothetical protein
MHLDEREIVTSREVENAGQLYPTSVLIVLLKFVMGDLSSAYLTAFLLYRIWVYFQSDYRSWHILIRGSP